MLKASIRQTLMITSLLLVLFFPPLVITHAAEYQGYGGKPAFPRADNPQTEFIFVHTLLPGAVQAEGIIILNNTTESKTLLVYAADSTPSSDGSLACKQLSEPQTDIGTWITFSKIQVTLEPNTQEMVPFTIRPPINAAPGEHNGCIFVQEKKNPVAGQTGVIIAIRNGLRVAVTIDGDIPAPPPSSGGGGILPTAKSTYLAEAVPATINWNLGFDSTTKPTNSPAHCVSDSLIKIKKRSTVYYCAADGRRYVFVNEKSFYSWYPNFAAVTTIDDNTMAQITIGGNVTYRPKQRLIKIQSDPKVYAVGRYGTLHWVTSEAVAREIYGAQWFNRLDDIPEAFLFSYNNGADLK